jgi:outer membrane scaffolding protein for murein synthesis (MipA/OmpV family)
MIVPLASRRGDHAHCPPIHATTPRKHLGDVDPRDTEALAAKVEELQADGLSWGGSPDLAAQSAEDAARMTTLSRMSDAAAGGLAPNSHTGDVDKASRIKARIDAGQEVGADEQAWFLSYTSGAVQQHTAARSKGY